MWRSPSVNQLNSCGITFWNINMYSVAITHNHPAVIGTTSLGSSPSLVDNRKLATAGGHRGCHRQPGLESGLAVLGSKEPEQIHPAEPELASFWARPSVTASCAQAEGDDSMETPAQRFKWALAQMTQLYQDRSWAGSVHPPKHHCRSPSEST